MTKALKEKIQNLISGYKSARPDMLIHNMCVIHYGRSYRIEENPQEYFVKVFRCNPYGITDDYIGNVEF